MPKTESTARLNTEENILEILSPYLKVFRSLVPQDYLLSDINRVDSSLNKTLQQTKQSSVVNTTVRFFRPSTKTAQKGQNVKREAVDNDSLSTVNVSDPELEMLANINLDIPADQLDDFIKGLEAELYEPAQKKIKVESPQP